MGRRIELQQKLVSILGSKYVYYNPPEKVKLVYPCIVYNLSKIKTENADDINYLKQRCYNMQFISYEENEEMVDALLDLPYCSHKNHTVYDGLHHDTFTIYY